MDDQNKNLLLATGLSFLVLIGWMFLFPPDQDTPITPEILESEMPTQTENLEPTPIPNKKLNGAESANAGRIKINTNRLIGSIWLKGGRIDDLKLLDYYNDQEVNSKNVTIL